MNGIYAIKPAFQKALRPFENFLVKARVHPDAVTMAALIVSAAGGTALAISGLPGMLGMLCSTPIFAFIRTALNALDGMVAQRTATARPWGEVLNEFSDRLSDLVIFAGLFLSRLAYGPLLASVLVTILLSSFMGVLSKAAGAKRQFGGLMGKADRMVLLGLMGPLAFFLENKNLMPASVVVNSFLAIVLVASVVTLVQRGARTYVDLKSSD